MLRENHEQVELKTTGESPLFPNKNEALEGYRIHCSITRAIWKSPQLVFKDQSDGTIHVDGIIDKRGQIFGPSLHGLFENDLFRWRFMNWLRSRKSLLPIASPLLDFKKIEDEQIGESAAFVADHPDLDKLENILDARP